jgi:hypothetical protein
MLNAYGRSADYTVAGYYISWGAYDRNYTPRDIDVDKLSPAMRELASKLSGKEVVVYHGEARSSAYTASFSEDVAEFLSQAGLTAVSFTPLRKLSAKMKQRVHEVATGEEHPMRPPRILPPLYVIFVSEFLVLL